MPNSAVLDSDKPALDILLTYFTIVNVYYDVFGKILKSFLPWS